MINYLYKWNPLPLYKLFDSDICFNIRENIYIICSAIEKGARQNI